MKPFWLVTVIVEVPTAPALTCTLEGDTATVKPITLTVMFAERDRAPLVPVTTAV